MCWDILLPGNNIQKFRSLIGRGDNRAVTALSFAHVTTKTRACAGVFGFFRFFSHNICPPHPNHFLKIQWEIHFWTFFVMIEMLQKKIKIINTDILILNLLSESISDFGETEIMPITTIGVIGIISVVPLPEAWYWFQKQI